MKYFCLILFLLGFNLSASAQIIGPIPEGQQNSIYQNSVSNMAAYGDTLWIGPLLQRHTGVNPDWFTAENADSVAKGRGRVYSLSLAKDTVVAGIGYNITIKNGDTDVGMGFYLSTDGGNTWTFIKQPLQAKDDTTYQYGGNLIHQLPVIVPEQSPPYSVSFRGNTIFAASWASGILRSTDFGKTWKRLILPPSSVDTLTPQRSYQFDFDPRKDNNFLGFGVLIASDGYVWLGSANGINISPNALTASPNNVIWYHVPANSSVNGLLGNWVVTIKEQPSTHAIWMTNWVTGSNEQYGIVSTYDHGKTFRHYLVGEKIYDIAFGPNTIYAVGDNGFFMSTDNGATWNHISQIKSTDTFIKPNASYYSLARTSDAIWVGTSDGLASSTNNGKSWQITRVNLPLNGGNRFQPHAPDVEAYAYPNPFSINQHGIVRIKFDVKKSGNVSIKLYDFGMNLIRVLDDKYLNVGTHEAVWNGLDTNGNRVANGVVFYQIHTPSGSFMGKILVLQ